MMDPTFCLAQFDPIPCANSSISLNVQLPWRQLRADRPRVPALPKGAVAHIAAETAVARRCVVLTARPANHIHSHAHAVP